MTRDEHIKRAEELLREYRGNFQVWHPTPDEIAIAQVHATLALAAEQPLTVGDDELRGRQR